MPVAVTVGARLALLQIGLLLVSAVILGVGQSGVKATPRNTVLVAAAAKSEAVEATPVSVIFTKRLAFVSVVVAYMTGFAPLKSTVKPRAPKVVLVPVLGLSV